MTCRDEIHHCVDKIIRFNGKNQFTLGQILDCMRQSGTKYPESTIRTLVTSALCKNAPVNHVTSYADFERIGHGVYTKLGYSPSPKPCVKTPNPPKTASPTRVTPSIKEIPPTINQAEGREALLAFGFKTAGKWALADDQLQLCLNELSHLEPALYAFVKGEIVLYIGKTAKTLGERMYFYHKPGPTQRTNTRNHASIKEELLSTDFIEIMCWADEAPNNDEEYFLDKAAGYEQALIQKLRPVWNRTGLRR